MKQNHRPHICSFEAVELTAADKRDYEAFKRAVLLAGRFSVFEATETPQLANLYTRLCRDPEIVTDHTIYGFPWTDVRLLPAPPAAATRGLE